MRVGTIGTDSHTLSLIEGEGLSALQTGAPGVYSRAHIAVRLAHEALAAGWVQIGLEGALLQRVALCVQHRQCVGSRRAGQAFCPIFAG